MISQAFFFILVCIISNIFTITYREFFGKCLEGSIFDLFLCDLKAEEKFILSIFLKIRDIYNLTCARCCLLVCFGLVSLTSNFQVCNFYYLKEQIFQHLLLFPLTVPLFFVDSPTSQRDESPLTRWLILGNYTSVYLAFIVLRLSS